MASHRRDGTAKERLTPAAVAYGARSAGLVLVFGALLGIARASAIEVLVGLALACFGRSVLAEREKEPAFLGCALLVIAGATWVVTTRWGSPDLGDIRGAQAILGHTVAVGPVPIATGIGLAAGGGFLALALWAGDVRSWARRRRDAVFVSAEVLAGALFIVTLFAGPRLVWSGTDRLAASIATASWVLLTALVSAGAVALGAVVTTRAAVSAIVAGVAAAAAVVGRALVGIS